MLDRSVRFAQALAFLILATGAALGSVEAMAAAEAAPADAHAGLQPQSGSSFVLEQFYRGTDSASKEFGAARSDHATIALDIGQCYYKEIGDPIHWPPTVRAILLFELDEHMMHKVSYDGSSAGSGRSDHALPILHPFHAAAISFSDRISRDRLAYRLQLEDSRSRSETFQLLILCLGAGATVFASVRAILQGHTIASGIVGVLAIVFSAAGVAVSSMNSFEGSQATALRDQRALSQLQQLHWRVASDVLKRPNLCSNTKTPPGEEMNVVDAWRTRLEAILDSAVESISKPGDTSTGDTPRLAAQSQDEPVRSAATGQ